VRCRVTVGATATARLTWRLTRRGHTAARGTLAVRGGAATLTVPAGHLPPGTYRFVVAQGGATTTVQGVRIR
jgi:hypothetical protein